MAGADNRTPLPGRSPSSGSRRYEPLVPGEPISDYGDDAPRAPRPVFATAPARSIPVTPPPPADAAAAPPRRLLADLIGADGGVDINAVYRLGRVPEAPLSAELLRTALAKLPPDVPERARRAALNVTVNALCQSAGAARDAVVDDARLRLRRLEQFLTGLEDETQRRTEGLRGEVERMEAELAQKRAVLEAADRTLAAARAGCGERVAELDEVLRLLAPAERPEKPSKDEPGTEETPPFAREESVLRMLAARRGEAI